MKLRSILEIDYLLLLPVIILMMLGVFFIYSSGITSDGIQVSNEHYKQIIWASIGLVIAIIMSLINYRRIYNLSIYIYLLSLLPLKDTLLFGHEIYNS